MRHAPQPGEQDREEEVEQRHGLHGPRHRVHREGGNEGRVCDPRAQRDNPHVDAQHRQAEVEQERAQLLLQIPGDVVGPNHEAERGEGGEKIRRVEPGEAVAQEPPGVETQVGRLGRAGVAEGHHESGEQVEETHGRAAEQVRAAELAAVVARGHVQRRQTPEPRQRHRVHAGRGLPVGRAALPLRSARREAGPLILAFDPATGSAVAAEEDYVGCPNCGKEADDRQTLRELVVEVEPTSLLGSIPRGSLVPKVAHGGWGAVHPAAHLPAGCGKKTRAWSQT
mmetsp:Transcript_65665/g.203336  ORF Transcript_65665/g.203336 Transcript_65665/m.203336 type:complete len:282 (+) Transcript_65665:931-1776(+)